MPIASIELKDFTAFREAEIALSPGLNVFVGENGTGKTHVMKALYAVAKAASVERGAPTVADKLVAVFRPDDRMIGRLGHRGADLEPASITVRDDDGGHFTISISTDLPADQSGHTTEHGGLKAPVAAVFLPSREGLAMYEGFIAAYQKRELSFDETYFDLAVSLSATALRGALPRALTQIGTDLEAALGGKIVLKGPRFYLREETGSMLEAPLLSEGMRKLASVLRLLQNGELRSTGLLLWDEPEANLNPKLTVVVANALARLAKNRVQVVLATHDYLLVETLSLLASERKGPPTRFFSFERPKTGTGVVVTGVDRLAELPSNPIRDEFLAHYDRVRAAAE